MANAQVPLSIAQLKQFAVNRPDQYEITKQTLYDTQTYAAAGQTSLTFFQDPIGASGKTKADTNMESSGQLPAPKYFLVESIEIRFFPGISPVTSSAGPVAPVAAESFFSNDMYSFQQNGFLDFFIGSKSYLTEAPLGKFPAKTKLEAAYGVAASAASTVDAFVNMDYATMAGRPYFIDPQITLIPNQNFNVTLNWPTAVALPSTVDARVNITLDGLLYRLSQ